MKKLTKELALKIWKEKICDKDEEVDPENIFTWEGIFIGLVIGLGGTIKQANAWYDDAFNLEGDSI